MQDVGLGQIRGAAVDEFLAWYAAERDGTRLAAVVEALPVELREQVRWQQGRPRLIPFAWYPCPLIHGILDGVLAGSSDAARDRLSHDVAVHVMNATLHGVYKAMFKAIVSPSLMARFSPRLWRLYYDNGESEVVIESQKSHRSILSGWKGHHPFLCDVNRYSGEWIYAALGCARVVSKRVQCVSQGGDSCIVVTSWG